MPGNFPAGKGCREREKERKGFTRIMSSAEPEEAWLEGRQASRLVSDDKASLTLLLLLRSPILLFRIINFLPFFAFFKRGIAGLMQGVFSYSLPFLFSLLNSCVPYPLSTSL